MIGQEPALNSWQPDQGCQYHQLWRRSFAALAAPCLVGPLTSLFGYLLLPSADNHLASWSIGEQIKAFAAQASVCWTSATRGRLHTPLRGIRSCFRLTPFRLRFWSKAFQEARQPLLKDVPLQAVEVVPPLLVNFDEVRVVQDLDVIRDRRLRDRKGLFELRTWQDIDTDHLLNDLHAQRLSEGTKDRNERCVVGQPSLTIEQCRCGCNGRVLRRLQNRSTMG